MRNLKYILLQARKEKDPMIKHEAKCFQKSLNCHNENLHTIDLIRDQVTKSFFLNYDAVIIGGSGDFSIAKGGPWMNKVLDIMNYLYEENKITFASCWGFQAMAKARGGEVVHDLKRAELGTIELHLTTEGKKDKVFQNLPERFFAQMGHEDIVDKLPHDAILLASSKKVKNEAFRFKKKPIYCTQFHPELKKNDLKQRMETYPSYVRKILGISNSEFLKRHCLEAKDTEQLIRKTIHTCLKNF
tara:strand:- start:6791 stop:7522 length:732 start_codon:yes stop_codon:yes gene_type:complete